MEELLALLPPMAQNYVQPSTPQGMKMMAASGALPLPPQHLGLLLVCLAFDTSEQVAQRAVQTFAQQNDTVINHLINHPSQHPVALDFAARQLLGRDESLRKIALHNNTSGDTLAWMASQVDGDLLELLALNQQRQLDSPILVQYLLYNPNLRTDHRARILEFALRQGIETGQSLDQIRTVLGDQLLRELGLDVPDTPVAPATTEQPIAEEVPPDAAPEVIDGIEVVHEDNFVLPKEFEEEIGDEDDAPVEEAKKLTLEQELLAMNVTEKIKAAIRGNKQVRSKLIMDANRLVSSAVLNNPRITENEVIKIASSRSVSEDIIREVTRNREWMKIYQVKVSLVNNPKCPTGVAIRLLSHMRPSELRNLAGSKNVPSVVALTAKKMMNQKGKR